MISFRIFITAAFLLLPGLTACTENVGPAGGREERPLPEDMSYSYDCLSKDDAGMVDLLRQGEEITRNAIAGDIVVTDADQSKAGDDFLKEIKNEPGFKTDATDPLNKTLKVALAALLRKRINPSSIRYGIFLLDDRNTVNAFTFGGKIFVTKAIIARCQTQDQLYAIIGHEIGHNEKGHVKKTIQERQAARNMFGDYGDAAMGLKQSITAVFNQQQELEADYYGIDLTWMLGYDVCGIVSFWKGMAKNETYSKWEDLLRSHPFSKNREDCLRAHLSANFDTKCAL